MRHTAAEKYEIIRLVEGSDLPVRQTLRELQVNRSTVYAWYHRYTARGQAGLLNRSPVQPAGTGTGFRPVCGSEWSMPPWPLRRSRRASWPRS